MSDSEKLIEVFHATDAEVATAIEKQRLHRGTALLVMRLHALELEKIGLGEVIARQTEAAAAPQESYGG
jgi:hypothetical protein